MLDAVRYECEGLGEGVWSGYQAMLIHQAVSQLG